MKGYVIDPEQQTITEIEHNGDYRQIYELIDNGGSPFCTVRISAANDIIFLDDEGLLKDPEFFFCVSGYAQPLAGKGLVLAIDDEGETVAARISLEALTDMISFRRLRVEGFEQKEDKTTLFGQPAVRLSRRTIFSERK